MTHVIEHIGRSSAGGRELAYVHTVGFRDGSLYLPTKPNVYTVYSSSLNVKVLHPSAQQVRKTTTESPRFSIEEVGGE